jgi:hypothetical protein
VKFVPNVKKTHPFFSNGCCCAASVCEETPPLFFALQAEARVCSHSTEVTVERIHSGSDEDRGEYSVVTLNAGHLGEEDVSILVLP